MKRSRRVLQTVCEFLVAFVLVVMSIVGTGAITLPVAHVVPMCLRLQRPL